MMSSGPRASSSLKRMSERDARRLPEDEDDDVPLGLHADLRQLGCSAEGLLDTLKVTDPRCPAASCSDWCWR